MKSCQLSLEHSVISPDFSKLSHEFFNITLKIKKVRQNHHCLGIFSDVPPHVFKDGFESEKAGQHMKIFLGRLGVQKVFKQFV